MSSCFATPFGEYQHRLLVLAGVAALGLCRSAAAAEQAQTARLVYQRGPGAETCPEDQWVRHAVTARLGYSPFSDSADRTIEASVVRSEGGHSATVALRSASGELEGERTIASQHADCSELGQAVALAISIAIDPLNLGPPTAAEPRQATPAPAPAPAPAAPRPKVELGAGVTTSLGLEVAPAFGVSVGGALRWSYFSLGLEGRAEFPSSVEAENATVTTSLLWAAVVPCINGGPFAGCAVVAAGAFRTGSQNLDGAHNTTVFHVAAGVRGTFSFPLNDTFSARASLEVLAPLDRVTLRVSGREVWTSPVLGGDLGVSIVARF